MIKAWCEAHHATEPVVIGGKEDNYAVHNAMGTGPYQLVSREPDRKTVVEKQSRLVGQDAGQRRSRRIRRHLQRADPRRRTAVGRGGHDLLACRRRT